MSSEQNVILLINIPILYTHLLVSQTIPKIAEHISRFKISSVISTLANIIKNQLYELWGNHSDD